MSNLTTIDNSRFVLFPIKYDNLWKMFKHELASYWVADEIDLSEDRKYWDALSDNEKHFISYVLAYFSSSDSIISENLACNFYSETGLPEARAFFAMQIAMETIHSETYALLIDTFIRDEKEKQKLFNAIETIPIVKKKAEWALKWMNSKESFESRIIAFAAIEGIFFSSSFCALFWLKKSNLFSATSGLITSNLLISKDESLHCDFACLLHSLSDSKVPKEKILEIIKDAVEVEKSFCAESLPVELIGMNSKLMIQYVEFVADHLLQSLDCEKHYKVENPFDFMEMISLQNKINFFEGRPVDYKKSHVGKTEKENTISFDADF